METLGIILLLIGIATVALVGIAMWGGGHDVGLWQRDRHIATFKHER